MSRINHLHSKPFEQCLTEHCDNKETQKTPNSPSFQSKMSSYVTLAHQEGSVLDIIPCPHTSSREIKYTAYSHGIKFIYFYKVVTITGQDDRQCVFKGINCNYLSAIYQFTKMLKDQVKARN